MSKQEKTPVPPPTLFKWSSDGGFDSLHLLKVDDGEVLKATCFLLIKR